MAKKVPELPPWAGLVTPDAGTKRDRQVMLHCQECGLTVTPGDPCGCDDPLQGGNVEPSGKVPLFSIALTECSKCGADLDDTVGGYPMVGCDATCGRRAKL